MATNPRAFGPSLPQSNFQPGQPLNQGPRSGLGRLSSGGGEFRSATAIEDLPSFRRPGLQRLGAGAAGDTETPGGAVAGQGMGEGENPFSFSFDDLFAGLSEEGGEGQSTSPLARLQSLMKRPQKPQFGDLVDERSQAWQDAGSAIKGVKTGVKGTDDLLKWFSGAGPAVSGAERLAQLFSGAFAPDVLSSLNFSLSGLEAPAAMTAAELGVTAADLGAGAGAGTAAGAGAGSGASLAGGISTAAQVLPYLVAAYSIADRGANSQFSSDQQAAMAAIELAGAILAVPTGGLSSIIAMGGNSFFKPELTHEQREALEYSRLGKTFNAHVLPRLRGAQSVEELAKAFAPTSDWGRDTGTILANGRPITHPDVLEMLSGGLQDPGTVTLDWQQGVSEDKRAYLNDVLNNLVRQQLALISAARQGDPRATQILGSYTASRDLAPLMAQIQSGSAELYSPEGTPTQLPDPNFDWQAVRRLMDLAGGTAPQYAGWNDYVNTMMSRLGRG